MKGLDAQERDPLLIQRSGEADMLINGYKEKDDEKTEVSVWRWWALIIFSCMSLVQNAAWICFNTVVIEAKEYYDISDAQVNRLVELGSLIWVAAIIVTIPLVEKLGVRFGVIFGCFCVMAGGLSRWLGRTSYTWLFIGQMLNGVAGPVITNCPPQLAAEWFPLHQRTTATAIAWNAMSIGVCVGYLLAPILAKSADDIPFLNRFTANVSIGLFVVSLTFPQLPRLPPTQSASVERIGMIKSTRTLLTNRSFMLLAIGFGIAMGSYITWSSMLDIFLEHKYTSKKLGWLGFAGNVLVVVGGIAVPAAVDALGAQRSMKVILIFCSFAIAIGVTAFFWVAFYFHGRVSPSASPSSAIATSSPSDSPTVSYSSRSLTSVPSAIPTVAPTDTPRGTMSSMWITGIGYLASSFAFGASCPLGVELAIEIAFPVSENVSATYLNFVSMLVSFGTMEAFNTLSHQVASWTVSGCWVFCGLMALLISVPTRRLTMDSISSSLG